MKKNKIQKQLLEELKKVPIIQVACERCGVSRNSFYKWKRTDNIFEKKVEEAMKEGVAFVNDMSESQLLTLIKEKSWNAISFWLRNNHSRYKNKIELTNITKQEELTSEQETLVREALKLTSSKPLTFNENQYEQSTTPRVSPTNDKE